MTERGRTSRSIVALLPRAVQPLSRRLPLLVISIVAVMMVIVVYLGFRRVDRLVGEVAAAQLATSAHQLQSTLELSAGRLRRDAAQLATAPELRKAASVFASRGDLQSATSVLEGELERDPQVSSVALWSERGRLLAVAGDRALAESAPPASPEASQGNADTAMVRIEPLVTRNDSVFSQIRARIRGTAGNAGHIVVTRRISSTPEALSLLRGLVGKNARILLGNADGSVWTDLSRRVTSPSAVPQVGSGRHVTDGVKYLHAAAHVRGTPWMVMVEAPRAWTLRGSGGFVLEMVGVAGFLLLVGALILWMTIQRSLGPLQAVTAGVVRLSRGDRSVAVPVHADDELGHLSSAFNSMAAQVSASAEEVATRARDLEAINRQLRESEQRYRVLVDHLPDAILVHRDQVIIFANRAAAKLLGASAPEELIGRSVLESVDEKDRPLVSERALRIQMTRKGAPRREITIRRADGTPMVVEATSMPLTLGGSTAVQTILHDVTEHRALEAQLRHSQKMDAVGRLAGGVAHDFNNILTVIDAYAEFAMRPDETAETRMADIGEIRKASASAARLTRQLLAFSRKQAVTPVTLDLNSAVRGLTTMLTRLIGDGVVISMELSEPLGAIFADASHVEQVLMNLAVNARDAMPHGGTLTFRTKNVTIGPNHLTPAGECVQPGEYVLLAVQDTGVGMTAEVRSKVFEPFFTTKQAGQGTGLGLATVYGIVKQSGAHIWIDSAPNAGTTLNLLFPTYTPTEDAPVLSRTAEHRIHSREAHILLVEDQESVRGALSRALRHAGFIVHEAANAETAEALLASADAPQVDLIVTDMMMPGKTGAEFTSGPLVVSRDIPVIIMSGYSEAFTKRAWRLPPNASLVDKPVRPSDLLRLINTLIG